MSKDSWKKGTCKLAYRDNRDLAGKPGALDISALVKTPLAIHKHVFLQWNGKVVHVESNGNEIRERLETPIPEYGKTWVITHAASGMGVIRGIQTQAEAKKIADTIIEEFGDVMNRSDPARNWKRDVRYRKMAETIKAVQEQIRRNG